MIRRRWQSLQAQLVWRLAALFLAGTAMVFGGVLWQTLQTLDSMQDRSLQAQAADLERHLATAPDGTPRLDLPASLQSHYDQFGRAFLFAIYDAAGQVLASSSAFAPTLLAGDLPAGDQPQFFQIETNPNGPYFGYVRPAGAVRIAVAQGDLHQDVLADSLAEEWVRNSIGWIGLILLLALAVSFWTIRRSLAPVQALSDLASQIGPRQTALRLPEAKLPSEVLPLVRAVNDALDRLEAGFELQRRFVADAAHELRTPLAVLTARLDGLAAGQDKLVLRQDVGRINRVVEQLLSVARLDAAPSAAPVAVDGRRLAMQVISQLAPRALKEQRVLALVGAAAPAPILADPAALGAALANLIENACNHTPRGTNIEVELAEQGSITVRDHGLGIAPDQRDAVFRRFWRGPGAKVPGAGLGLAIVTESLRAIGGRVELTETPGGGASFTLHLPPAPPPDPALAPSPAAPAMLGSLKPASGL